MSRKITWSESQVFEVSVWLNWGDIPLISRGRMKRIAWITFVFPFIINHSSPSVHLCTGEMRMSSDKPKTPISFTRWFCPVVVVCFYVHIIFSFYFFFPFRFRRWVVLHLNKGILVGWMWIIKNWDNTHTVRSKLPKRAARKLLKTTHTYFINCSTPTFLSGLQLKFERESASNTSYENKPTAEPIAIWKKWACK